MIPWLFAAVAVRLRGWRNLLAGRTPHRSGLTKPCSGCAETSSHDAHLAAGALTYLHGRR